MTMLLALGLFIAFFIGLLGFIRFCEWVLSRREVTS
jgi:hypothetical protein